VRTTKRKRNKSAILLPGKVKPSTHEGTDRIHAKRIDRSGFKQLFWSSGAFIFPRDKKGGNHAKQFQSGEYAKSLPGHAEEIAAGDWRFAFFTIMFSQIFADVPADFRRQKFYFLIINILESYNFY
jgi:hypothetical protein